MAEPAAGAAAGSEANTAALSGVGAAPEATGAATATDSRPQRGAPGRKPARRSEA